MLPISETTKVSKAQQKAVHKYVKNNYDRIELTVPKGHKAEIKAHADSQEESVNGFINAAIDEKMERDTAGIRRNAPECLQEATGVHGGPMGIPVSLDTLKTAQRAAGATGESVPDFVARAVETQEKRDKSLLLMGLEPIVSKGGEQNE